MSKDQYSTFQAAKILGVSPDTVLKWIKSGKVSARRTLGGHYRIRRDTVVELISRRASQGLPPENPPPQKSFQYCWEFNSKDETLRNDCRDCLVYKTRARLCYEMSSVPKELGHLKLFCDSNCEECRYYRYAREQSLGVLFITEDHEFLEDLENSQTILSFKTTDCEYECSAIVERMRPDIAVIDWSFHQAKEICEYLTHDSRIPYVKIIVVSNPELPFGYSNNKIIGHISKPLKIERIEEYIVGISA